MFRFIAYPVLILSLVALPACGQAEGENKQGPPTPSGAPKTYSAYPAMTIDPAKKYAATIETTAGKLVVDLFAAEAPKSVNSFVFLAKEGFYTGTIFHRVIPGFMVQGGDPTGTGRGGPGYKFDNENRETTKTFKKGTLGMANAGLHTNGSQFFIMHADYGLDPKSYTIWGQITEGQDIVDKIATAPKGPQDRPNEPVKINSITISEK